MTRYKHLRTNDIAYKLENSDMYVCNGKEIPAWLFENSEDWKLIPERQWEIIGFSGVVEKRKPHYKSSKEYLNMIENE